MKNFEIVKGTVGLLLTQEDHVDIKAQNWTTRKDLSYTDEHVLVDPVKFASFGNTACGFEKNSMAAKLAKGGYYVFSEVANIQSSYMIAVPADQVRIS
jgi:hypothetical protein